MTLIDHILLVLAGGPCSTHALLKSVQPPHLPTVTPDFYTEWCSAMLTLQRAKRIELRPNGQVVLNEEMA